MKGGRVEEVECFYAEIRFIASGSCSQEKGEEREREREREREGERWGGGVEDERPRDQVVKSWYSDRVHFRLGVQTAVTPKRETTLQSCLGRGVEDGGGGGRDTSL